MNEAFVAGAAKNVKANLILYNLKSSSILHPQCGNACSIKRMCLNIVSFFPLGVYHSIEKKLHMWLNLES